MQVCTVICGNTALIASGKPFRPSTEHEADIEIRCIKYLNNIVEQDRRAVKRVMLPTLGFKSFRSAAATLSSIEFIHIIRKDQSQTRGRLPQTQEFYALAA